MITITKGMVALSVLLSAGLVVAFDSSSPRAADQSAASQVAQRFPVTSEMFAPVPMAQFVAPKFNAQQPVVDGRKSDKQPAKEICNEQSWPYYTQTCLASTDGKPIHKVRRIITVERRIDDSTSELVRMPLTNLAMR